MKLFQKFIVTRTDGKPADGKYFVLNLNAKNPEQKAAAKTAFCCFIQQISRTDEEFALQCVQYLRESEG